MNPGFESYLLSITQAMACQEVEVIQSLWSGYGTIARYQLEGTASRTVVVKHISLTPATEHPRGWNTDASHNRKVKSYAVETQWYRHWNQECGKSCRTADFLGSYAEGYEQWIVLEDLDIHFPLRKRELSLSEVKSCLKWLANFHATFLGQAPSGLWEVGTYWHLASRADEFEKIEHPVLKANAQRIDDLLNQCRYQTIVHGDAKVANFCFSKTSEAIAAVDFQYVGGGCGMKDVAYFIGSCLSSSECERYQDELLDYYFSTLHLVFESSKNPIDFDALEQEWRSLYPIAWTDFTRFLLGWMPEHQKVNGYSRKLMESVLGGL
jgi:hypothetical protein